MVIEEEYESLWKDEKEKASGKNPINENQM